MSLKPEPGRQGRAPWGQVPLRTWLAPALAAVALHAHPALTAATPTVPSVRDLLATAPSKPSPSQVQFQGVVTFCSPVDHCVFVQDGTAALYVARTNLDATFNLGSQVEVDGQLLRRNGQVSVVMAVVRDLGTNAPLPAPERLDGLAPLERPELDGRWVEVKGVVRRLGPTLKADRLSLIIGDGSSEVLLIVENRPLQRLNPLRYIDAEVLVRAVNQRKDLTAVGLGVGQVLLAQSIANVQIVEDSHPPLSLAPPPPLPTPDTLRHTEHRLKVWGQVTQSRAHNRPLTLQAEGRVIRVEPLDGDEPEVGDWVEVLGFPSITPEDMAFTSAHVSLLGIRGTPQPLPPKESRRPNATELACRLPLLQSIGDIRKLQVEEARQELPVKVRGVLTFLDRFGRHACVQDPTDGIYVSPDLSGSPVPPKVGDLVEVAGFSGPGDYAPVINGGRFTTIEAGGHLPDPPPPYESLEPLLTGQMDSRWVALKGVIQAVNRSTAEPGHVNVWIGVGNRRTFAVLPHYLDRPLPRELTVNSPITVHAVCATDFTPDRRLRSVFLLCPDVSYMSVAPPPQTPGTTPPVHIGSLGTFGGNTTNTHRIQVTGRVTFRAPDNSFVVDDGTGALFADPSADETNGVPTVGDSVRLEGFLDLGSRHPRLVEAFWRPDAPQPRLAPGRRSALEIASTMAHARLFQLEAGVLNVLRQGRQCVLTLADDATVFRAVLALPDDTSPLPKVRAGGRVRVTGVANFEDVNPLAGGAPFTLQLRAADDVTVLNYGPRWTWRHLTQVVLGIGGILLAALIWVLALKRTIRTQATAIRRQFQQEAALQEHHRLVWETSGDGMRLTDAAGTVIRANQAYCDLMGRPREEIEQHPFTAALAPAEHAQAMARHHQLFQERAAGANTEDLVALADGRKVWLEVSTSYFEHPGQPRLLLAIFRDVTARRLAQDRLARLNQCLLGFTANPETNIGRVVDFCGQELRADAALYQRFDGTHLRAAATWRLPADFHCDDPPPHSCCHARTPQDTTQPAILRAAAPGSLDCGSTPPKGFTTCAAQAVCCNGTVLGRLCILFRSDRGIPPEELSLLGISASAVAVEETRRTEAERRLEMERKLLDAQRFESLGVMAGGVAHDFNNLLTAILGNAGLAASELPGDSPVRDYLREIETTSRQAADLCRQMLAYSGRGRFQLQRVEINRLLTELRPFLQLSIHKTASLRFELAPDAPTIHADMAQMRQVILNLVLNASEAIGETVGEIIVRTAGARFNTAQPAATPGPEELPAGSYLQIEVIDNGCGISADARSRIFEPFFSTKFAGRGLGLPAVLGIVRGHRGGITLESAPNHGTAVRVLLPTSDGTPETTAGSPSLPAAGWRGQGTILIADDEDAIRRLLSRGLTRLGFTVLTAADGQEALGILTQRPQELAAAIVDLTMPRISGTELCRKLKARQPGVPVILVSGFSEQDAVGRFADSGPDAFLQKPFEVDELVAKLRQLFENKALPPGSPPGPGAT